MRLISFLLFIISSAIVLGSCQKELAPYTTPLPIDSTVVDTIITADTSFLVKQYTENVYNISDPAQNVSDSFLLTYDNKNRLLSLASVTLTGSKIIYTYSSNTVTVDLYNGSTLSTHEIVFLKGSLVDSTFQDDQQGDTTTEKYTYSGKQVSQLNEYSFTNTNGSVPSGTTTYTYNTNGDLSSTAKGDTITSYTYTNNLTNNLNIGLNYYPVPKHLPDGISYIVSGKSTTGTHTYTFDTAGRLTGDTLELSDGSVAIKKYYY